MCTTLGRLQPSATASNPPEQRRPGTLTRFWVLTTSLQASQFLASPIPGVISVGRRKEQERAPIFTPTFPSGKQL